MPVPLPTATEANLDPPEPPEILHVARGVVTAISPPEGLTRLQTLCLRSLSDAMTGHPLDLTQVTPITATAYAEGLARRDRAFRVRMVQMMILLALLVRRVPQEVADRLQEFADELSVGDDCRELLRATRHLAAGALGLAMADFERAGYECMAYERDGSDGEEHTAAEYWTAAPHDPASGRPLAGPGALPGGLPRAWRCGGSTRRGASPSPAHPGAPRRRWPSTTGSTSWPTTARRSKSELEVFGLISRASDDPRAFTLLVQVLGLFEAGYLQTGMGLFEMDLGHVSAAEADMAVRLADAFRRGARAAWSHNDHHGVQEGIDFLAVDWFAFADRPIEEVRAHFFLDGAAGKPADRRGRRLGGPVGAGRHLAVPVRRRPGDGRGRRSGL